MPSSTVGRWSSWSTVWVTPAFSCRAFWSTSTQRPPSTLNVAVSTLKCFDSSSYLTAFIFHRKWQNSTVGDTALLYRSLIRIANTHGCNLIEIATGSGRGVQHQTFNHIGVRLNRLLLRRLNGFVLDVGSLARENYDATIRVDRWEWQLLHRSLQRFPVLGVRQSGAGLRHCRHLFACERSTISHECAAVQVLVCQFLEHNVRLVPVRSPQIRQLSHTSVGQIVQGYSSYADGKNCVAHQIRILRIFDGSSDFMRNAVFPAGQRNWHPNACGLDNHIDDGTVAADVVSNVRQFHIELASGLIQNI